MRPQISGGPDDPQVLWYYDGPMIFFCEHDGVHYLFFEAAEGLYSVMPMSPGDLKGIIHDLDSQNGHDFRTIRKLLDGGGWLWPTDGEVDLTAPRITFPPEYYPAYLER